MRWELAFILNIILVASCTKDVGVDEKGRRIFENGITSSGAPLVAKIDGKEINSPEILACAHCHFRSGAGSTEGYLVTPRIRARELYRPALQGSELLRKNYHKLPSRIRPRETRPAYTKETLARAIREGVDSGGNKLNVSMPRYQLSDEDFAHLSTYLNTLRKEKPDGVTDEAISFATVITDDVNETERDAMLAPLRAYVRSWNVDARNQTKRAQNGYLHGAAMYVGYRKIDLSVWELKGDRSTFEAQLSRFYKEKPIFALIGGMSNGDWKPIHDFCEKNRIPCLFPFTEEPVISDTDWYTIYFSKGVYQEGEAAARFLRNEKTPILQVYSEDTMGTALMKGFNHGLPVELKTTDLGFKLGQPVPWSDIEKIVREQKPETVVFWGSGNNLQTIEKLTSLKGVKRVFVSDTQVGSTAKQLPESVRPRVYFTYPYSLKKTDDRPYLLVRAWLRSNEIPITDLNVQTKTYFLSNMITAAMSKLYGDFQRERFLEALDMMSDQNYLVPVYPNLSFGPGQRYASKGCYIVQLDANGAFDKRSDWITY